MIVSETLNVALAETVRDFLRNHPQRHDQTHWVDGQVQVLSADPDLAANIPALIEALEAAWRDDVCMTTGCLAGWASLFAGYRQFKNNSSVYDPADFLPGEVPSYFSLKLIPMSEAARLALGLTDEQASALFWHRNTLDDIDDMFERIIADPSDQLDDVNADHTDRDEARRENQRVDCDCSACRY